MDNQQNKWQVPMEGENFKESLNQSQFGVWGVPFHTHNGTDSPKLPITSIRGTFYEQIAGFAPGAGTFYPFGSQVSPVSGTVTFFALVSQGINCTATLWGTTAGTMATITNTAALGSFVGGAVPFGAKLLAGDTLKVTTTNGAVNFFVNFQYSPS